MLNFIHPWILLLLPLPLFIYWLIPATKHKTQLALKIPFIKRIENLHAQFSMNINYSWKTLVFAFTIWLLLVISASAPSWLGKPITLPQSGRDIILDIDLSGSMRTEDMSIHGQFASRLMVVKAAARKFIAARQGDRLGLVLFGTKAYLQTPLTFDRKTVLQMLDDATIGLAGSETAIGDALGLSIKRLENAPGHSKVIILLTDGGNNSGVVSPIAAAQIAKALGIKIYTIGIGASKVLVNTVFGPQVVHPSSALDEATLKQIAHITGGLFFRAENSNDLQRVYESLNQLVPVVSQKNSFRPEKPLYPWPLGLAFCLSLIAFVRFL